MIDRDKKLIRNSTAEFLISTSQTSEQCIEARNKGKSVLHTTRRWRLE